MPCARLKLGLLLSGVTLIAAVGAPPSYAQPAVDREVVVIGERLSEAAREERVAAYIRQTGIAAGDRPTAR